MTSEWEQQKLHWSSDPQICSNLCPRVRSCSRWRRLRLALPRLSRSGTRRWRQPQATEYRSMCYQLAFWCLECPSKYCYWQARTISSTVIKNTREGYFTGTSWKKSFLLSYRVEFDSSSIPVLTSDRVFYAIKCPPFHFRQLLRWQFHRKYLYDPWLSTFLPSM